MMSKLFNRFCILKSNSEAENYFKTVDARFSIGIGGPILRNQLYHKFLQLGGVYTSTISQNTDIGSYDMRIGDGCNILSGVKISNSVELGLGCIVYYNSVITHDVDIGNFVEISPGLIF